MQVLHEVSLQVNFSLSCTNFVVVLQWPAICPDVLTRVTNGLIMSQVLVCETTMGNTCQHAYHFDLYFCVYVQIFDIGSCMQEPAGHQTSRYQEKVLGSLEGEACLLLYRVKISIACP